MSSSCNSGNKIKKVYSKLKFNYSCQPKIWLRFRRSCSVASLSVASLSGPYRWTRRACRGMANACRRSNVREYPSEGERTYRVVVNGSRIGRGLKALVCDAGWADGAARRGDCSRWLSSCGSRSLGRSHEGSKSRNWGHSTGCGGSHGMGGRGCCNVVLANYFLFNIILNLRLRFKMMFLVEYCMYFKK